jgi:hypothetical protein
MTVTPKRDKMVGPVKWVPLHLGIECSQVVGGRDSLQIAVQILIKQSPPASGLC